MAVRWRPTAKGFRFEGLPAGTLPERWLGTDTATRADAQLQLGPEPIIGRQAVLLQSVSQPAQRLLVATDGVRPFAVMPAPSP
jgi:general secretion pathway protein H